MPSSPRRFSHRQPQNLTAALTGLRSRRAVALPCDRGRDLFSRDGDTHECHPGRDLFLLQGPAAVARSLEGLGRLILDAATLVRRSPAELLRRT